MDIKSMFKFDGTNAFNTFTNVLETLEWRIEKQLLKERVDKYKDNEFYLLLRQTFNDKRLSIWPLKEEEVITWMDTLLIMRKTMIQLFKKGINGEKVKILMEYPLVFGNHMRTDYLIVYERLIIVLEFGMFNQDEKRSEERYTKKLQDSITHRQVLRNMINNDVIVVNYVLVYRPEFDRIHKMINKENIEYNHNEIKRLSDFIMHHVKHQDSLSAIAQLEMVQFYT